MTAEPWIPLPDSYVYVAGPASSISAPHLAGETGLIGWATKDGVQQALTGLEADADGDVCLAGPVVGNGCLPYLMTDEYTFGGFTHSLRADPAGPLNIGVEYIFTLKAKYDNTAGIEYQRPIIQLWADGTVHSSFTWDMSTSTAIYRSGTTQTLPAHPWGLHFEGTGGANLTGFDAEALGDGWWLLTLQWTSGFGFAPGVVMWRYLHPSLPTTPSGNTYGFASYMFAAPGGFWIGDPSLKVVGDDTELMPNCDITTWLQQGGHEDVTALSEAEADAILWPSTGGACPSGPEYEYTDIYIGLQHCWRYKTAKLAYGASKGTAAMQTKRVSRIGLLTQNEHPNAVEYGSDFDTTYARPRVEKGQDVDETQIREILDTDTFALGGIWDTDSRVCLKGCAPYPVTFLGLVVEVETSEDD